MAVELNAHEARVLGVLIEKAMTTPDVYPLSLNSITVGCNQKSNRDPEVDFSEAEVTVALTGLQMKHLVGGVTPAGSRVQKWRQNTKEVLGLDDRAVAVLAELLLRGAQSAAELRTRAKRMRDLPSQEAFEQALGALLDKRYARLVPAGAGSRVERYVQTLAATRRLDGSSDEAAPAPEARPTPSYTGPARAAGGAAALESGLAARVEALEREVAELRRRLEAAGA